MCSLSLYLNNIILLIGLYYINATEGSNGGEEYEYCRLDIDKFGKGLKGDPGDPGKSGQVGDKGDTGPQGPEGEKGNSKYYGDPFFQPQNRGPLGAPGSPGSPGSCNIPMYEFPYLADFETGEEIQLGPKENIITMYCSSITNEVCIRKNTTKSFNYKDKTNPFWISEIGIDLKTLYNLNIEQIEWLHKYSTYVQQTLRYHCRNSTPYSKNDVSRSLRLLGWNDRVIRPYPTEENPHFYSVPVETNGCQESDLDQYLHTDIILQSSIVTRLPVIDIQINDVRNSDQSFSIEQFELCFGLFYFRDNIEDDDEDPDD